MLIWSISAFLGQARTNIRSRSFLISLTEQKTFLHWVSDTPICLYSLIVTLLRIWLEDFSRLVTNVLVLFRFRTPKVLYILRSLIVIFYLSGLMSIT